MSDRIDCFVRDLAARLPRTRLRRRFVDEARAHLEDAAAELEATGLSPDEAAAAAIRRFGAPVEVADRLLAELRVGALTLRAPLVLVIALVFVVPLYVVPENALPPAPWATTPHVLAWKRDAAFGAYGVALVSASAAAALAVASRSRRPLTAAGALLSVSVVALATSAVLAAVVNVQWLGRVDRAVSEPLFYALVVPGVLLLAAGAVAIAADSLRLLLARPRADTA